MIVDCSECVVRGDSCAECVMTVLLGMPDFGADAHRADPAHLRKICLEQEERAALDALAEQGLVPRLRLVTSRLPSPEEVDGRHRAGDGGHGHDVAPLSVERHGDETHGLSG